MTTTFTHFTVVSHPPPSYCPPHPHHPPPTTPSNITETASGIPADASANELTMALNQVRYDDETDSQHTHVNTQHSTQHSTYSTITSKPPHALQHTLPTRPFKPILP